MMPAQNLRGDLDEMMLLMGSDGRDLAARELKKPKKSKKNEGASASASGVELDPDPAYSAVAPVEADCRTRGCGRGKICLVNNRGEHNCMKATNTPKKGKPSPASKPSTPKSRERDDRCSLEPGSCGNDRICILTLMSARSPEKSPSTPKSSPSKSDGEKSPSTPKSSPSKSARGQCDPSCSKNERCHRRKNECVCKSGYRRKKSGECKRSKFTKSGSHSFDVVTFTSKTFDLTTMLDSQS
eukprot:scaffold2077_cov72-Skeletonema_marinoi.AAC.1